MPTAKVRAALDLLQHVRRELCDDAMYAAVVSLLNKASKAELQIQLEALLAEYPSLIARFRDFLPPPPVAPPAVVVIDDEVEFVCSVGANALTDYPHPRHACAKCPFPALEAPDRATLAQVHCPRCFCFLCDAPAEDCKHWRFHSLARDNAAWLDIRRVLRSRTQL